MEGRDCTWGEGAVSLQPNFHKERLDRVLVLEGVAGKKEGSLFQGGGVAEFKYTYIQNIRTYSLWTGCGFFKKE